MGGKALFVPGSHKYVALGGLWRVEGKGYKATECCQTEKIEKEEQKETRWRKTEVVIEWE